MYSNQNSNPALKQIRADEIIDICRLKFINILPNTVNRGQQISHKDSSEKLSSMNNLYRRQQIKQVIHQLSLFLQLVIQNCVLTSDPKLRAECLKILGNFRNLLSKDLDDFQGLISSRLKSRLPQYDIDCRSFFKRDLTLRMPPQISLYQDPLLFYIYSRFAQEQLFCNHSITMTRNQRIEIIKGHVPFLNPLFIPIISERLETKAKFSQLEDRLLLIIISTHRDISTMRAIYFPDRPEAQIRNRIKNLCGNVRDVMNVVKEWKANQYLPLNEEELEILANGYSRFGPRWPVISKYYQMRTPDFLAAEFNDCEKLAKKREKEKIAKPYGSLRQVLQERVTRLKKRTRVEAEIEEELGFEDRKSELDRLEEMEIEPKYKIINHLTFMIEEI